jgi:copper chaperone NosL
MERKPMLTALRTLLAVASLSLSACGSAASGPPAIALDETACAHCGMLVSDLAFASAYRTPAGDALVFDDLGCLLRARPSEGARVWVKDYETSEWLDAEAAYFVRSQSIETPMGGGIVAFSTREAAQERGAVLRFPELKGGFE